MNKIYLILLLSCSLYSWISAQNSIPNSQSLDDQNINLQPWLDYNPSWSMGTRTTLYGSYGARTIFPASWHRLYARQAESENGSFQTNYIVLLLRIYHIIQ